LGNRVYLAVGCPPNTFWVRGRCRRIQSG
jgi:hypothetical protein